MITYSIIIPHYNIPQLLERCLQSIPIRDDTQVVVVDDCSNADSIAKLKILQEKFYRVKFIFLEQNNGGGAARNVGLRNATGKYIIFADADDFFYPSFNAVLDKYATSEFDLAFLNASSVDSDSLQPTKRALYLNKLFRIYRIFPSYALKLFKYAFGEPWAKIINSKLIKDHLISFDETKIHNDTKFSYETAFFSKKVIVDDTSVYCITDRVESVSKAISDDKQLTRVNVFAEKNLFLKKRGVKFVDEQVYYPFVYYWEKHNQEMLKKCFALLKAKNYNLLCFKYGLVKYYLIKTAKKFVKKIL